MPKKLHRQLEMSANKLNLKGKRRTAYIYGTLNKIEDQGHHSADDGNFLLSRRNKFRTE